MASLERFSITCGVLTIALLFLLLKSVFSKRSPYLEVLATLGPFLITIAMKLECMRWRHFWRSNDIHSAVERKNKVLVDTMEFQALSTYNISACAAHFVYIWLNLAEIALHKNIFRTKNVWLAGNMLCYSSPDCSYDLPNQPSKWRLWIPSH